MDIFNETSFKISKQITKSYSTSFYFASLLFEKEVRKAIFGIYGFVRLADEIVDSFHDYNKPALLKKFEVDYYQALHEGISLNPVLQSFTQVVKHYNIPDEYVQAFLKSMKYDLDQIEYSKKDDIDKYIYGSAEVVGLMCLKVFCANNEAMFEELKYPAKSLGAAFQKVNFLRDLRDDIETLNRQYFPNVDRSNFDEETKKEIITDIKKDFSEAYTGILKLPRKSQSAVKVAYLYYMRLLTKIELTPSEKIISERIRVSNVRKTALLTKAYILNKLSL